MGFIIGGVMKMIKNKIGYIMCLILIKWNWLRKNKSVAVYEMYIDRKWIKDGFFKA